MSYKKSLLIKLYGYPLDRRTSSRDKIALSPSNGNKTDKHIKLFWFLILPLYLVLRMLSGPVMPCGPFSETIVIIYVVMLCLFVVFFVIGIVFLFSKEKRRSAFQFLISSLVIPLVFMFFTPPRCVRGRLNPAVDDFDQKFLREIPGTRTQ